jgi:hypothetical protein
MSHGGNPSRPGGCEDYRAQYGHKREKGLSIRVAGKGLRIHLVGILPSMYFFPYAPEASGIHGRFVDHAQAIIHLPGDAVGFAVDVLGVACKVAHQEVEDLV